MDAQAVITVSAAVVALAQLAKWYGVPDGKGPIAVMILSALGTLLWVLSSPAWFDRTQGFAIFSAWIAVTLNAAGVFGFTRAAASAVTSTSNPPSGAGASPTVKS